MSLREFLARHAALHCLDWADVSAFVSSAEWEELRDDPVEFIARADMPTAERLWALMEQERGLTPLAKIM